MVDPHYFVSYGVMGDVAVFTTAAGTTFGRGQDVVVVTDRGTEVGTILAQARETSTDPEMEEDGDSRQWDQWRVLRALGPIDAERLVAHAERRQEEFDAWQHRLARLMIRMELVDVEYLLDDAAVVLHVLADEDADFSPIQSTLSKIAGKRLIFRRFGEDPAGPRKAGCAGGSCTCGRKES